jgi:multiple sugar transport system substrate-binding protein
MDAPRPQCRERIIKEDFMSGKHVTRREFIRLAGLVGGAAALAACSPAAPQPAAQPAAPAGGAAATPAPAAAAPAPGQVTISLWQSDWGKDWNDPMLRLSDAFTKEVMPNTKFEYTIMPALTEKLSAAIAGGNVPDVAVIDESYGIPKMARAGGLISMKDLWAKDGLKNEDFIPFTVETVLYKTEPFAVPGGAGTVVNIINNDAMKEIGVDPKSLPDTPTWDEWSGWVQKLVKKDDKGKVTRMGFTPSPGGFAHFGGILGWQYYNADKTKLAVNSPESVAALEKYVGLLPQGIPYDDISNMLAAAPTSSYGTLGTGLEGIVLDGFWAYLALDKYWPKLDYTMNKLPTPKGSKDEWKLYTGWVWDVALPKGVKHLAEGWAFIKYGYWDHGAMLADTLNWTCALKQFPEFEKRTIALMGETNRERPFLHHFTEAQNAGAYFIPYTPAHPKMMDGLTAAIDSVIRGQKKAQQAMDELVAAVQPELDKVLAEG